MAFPPQPLSPEQRQRLCALLGMGTTRRMAVRYVGCRLADFEAELRRDSDFKRQVQQHELRPEIEVLRSLLDAARDPKQWRAAAWVLERFYPRRYAARKANAVKPGAMGSKLHNYLQRHDAVQADPQPRRKRDKSPRAPGATHDQRGAAEGPSGSHFSSTC